MFQQMGFGVAIALLVDATIVGSVLVPASMKLLGERNWYLPAWLSWVPEGYLFTGAWTILVGAAMLQSSTFESWLAWPGIAIGISLVVGSLEFVGGFEEQGWKLAGALVPIAYTAWSLWLLGAGVALLVG